MTKSWRPEDWEHTCPWLSARCDECFEYEDGADAIINGINEELDLFFKRITDINLALWASSWGRLQCNAETADGKKYQSWAGRPNDELSIELILNALGKISEQLK